MTNPYIFQLSEALKILVERTDKILQNKPWNPEQEARLMSGLERLIEVINQIERQQKVESCLVEKVEETVSRLSKVLTTQNRAAGGIKGDLVESIERAARSVKIVGQAAEFIAESMQVISNAYRKKNAATTNTENGDKKTDAVDLTGILTQLNDLIETKVKVYASEGAQAFPAGKNG